MSVRFPIHLFRPLRHLPLAIFLATALPVVLLRWLPPPTSAFMLNAQLSAYLEGDAAFRLRYAWTDWDDISPAAKLAVIAAEDQLFSEHLGFDFAAMEKAWRHNQAGRHLRGASTLSQQTAKNLFLYPGRSYVRKALEAYFTALIEALWPKRRILEVYLNIAQFGAGLYGVGEAGQAYFGTSAARLGEREAALLAAVLPNPLLLKADRPSAYVRVRQTWILRQMRQLGGPGHLDKFARSEATSFTRALAAP